MAVLKKNRTTILFVAVFLLGGGIHFFSWPLEYYLYSLPFSSLTCIYAGLILFWAYSVWQRLTPSPARRYTMAAILQMFLFLVLRTIRYCIAMTALTLRLCWYGYYIPLILIPSFFLLFTVEITDIRRRRPMLGRAILLTGAFLVLGICTNDLHQLAFRPLIDMAVFRGDSGTYTHEMLYYLACGWVALMIAAGVLCLFIFASRRRRWRQMAGPLLFLGLIPLLTAAEGTMRHSMGRSLWVLPEICIFCFLGVFEACFRSGLVPYNENYIGFFAGLDFPVLITDKQLQPVYRTSKSLEASPEQLRAALRTPIFPKEEWRLSGMELTAGYAFWEEDEGELRRANEQLREANETIGLENKLIQYENELREERAAIEARTAVYEKAAAYVYPVEQRIEQMLAEMEADTLHFRERVARISLLNAYVKRKLNFVLSFSEEEQVPARELALAMGEMCHFLRYCGVAGSVECMTDTNFPWQTVMDCYDCFQQLVESLLPHMSKLMAVVREEGLRISVDMAGTWEPPELPLPVAVAEEEGYLYLSVSAERGGAK